MVRRSSRISINSSHNSHSPVRTVFADLLVRKLPLKFALEDLFLANFLGEKKGTKILIMVINIIIKAHIHAFFLF